MTKLVQTETVGAVEVPDDYWALPIGRLVDEIEKLNPGLSTTTARVAARDVDDGHLRDSQ